MVDLYPVKNPKNLGEKPELGDKWQGTRRYQFLAATSRETQGQALVWNSNPWPQFPQPCLYPLNHVGAFTIGDISIAGEVIGNNQA